MKATLEFEIPEERTEHLCAVNSMALYSAIIDADNRLRSILKHDNYQNLTVENLAHELRDLFIDALGLIE